MTDEMSKMLETLEEIGDKVGLTVWSPISIEELKELMCRLLKAGITGFNEKQAEKIISDFYQEINKRRKAKLSLN